MFSIKDIFGEKKPVERDAATETAQFLTERGKTADKRDNAGERIADSCSGKYWISHV